LIVKNSHFATMEFSRCARAPARPTKNRAGCFFNSRARSLKTQQRGSCTSRSTLI